MNVRDSGPPVGSAIDGEVIARLVERHVVARELVDVLRDRADELGERLHLADRGVDHRVGRAVHEAGHEIGEADIVDQRQSAIV